MAKGTFPMPEVVKALNNNAGNEEAALLELQKNQLKPFLMRIWGPPVGVENEDAAPIGGSRFASALRLFLYFRYQRMHKIVDVFFSPRCSGGDRCFKFEGI